MFARVSTRFASRRLIRSVFVRKTRALPLAARRSVLPVTVKTQIRLHHPEQHCDHPTAAVGGKAPDFEAEAVVGTEFKKVKLADYRGKWVVLFFYPLDFTFVCPTEIIEFSEKAKDFRKINTEVIGVSCDSKFTHLAWINTPRKAGGLGKLDIPLLADFKKTIAGDYGALFLQNGFPLRASYIIDPEGVIRQITLNATSVGRNVDEVHRLVQAFQHTDKHGEVCPVNWKPGDAAINVSKANDYFGKKY